jgi:hypothetical protein
MSNHGTTSVDEKDIPAAPPFTLTNLPDSMEAAVERIMALEACLEDLARAAEISRASGQYEIMESFVDAANTTLQDKIVREYNNEPFQVTIIS